MAPLPLTDSTSIRDLTLSSLELDSRSSPIDLPSYLSALSLPELESLNNPPPAGLTKRTAPLDTPLSNPLTALPNLTPRNPAPAPPTVGSGSVPPNAINMKGIQALFAIIGAFFVICGIWFFFWAKNGGFRWRKGDWDDYKSTVLRRKGPDGKTLSNATKSTRLGGGSVVASGYSDEGTETMTELSSEAPIIKEKRSGKKGGKKAGKGLRGGGGGGGGVAKENKKAQHQRQQKEERWEGGFDNDVRAYRHEKPAKVGGLNRDSDAQFYGTDYSETEPSSFGGAARRLSGGYHRQTTTSRQSSRQSSPHKHHHQQPQQQKQTRPRDFSYGHDHTFTATPTPSRPTRYSSPNKPATPRHSVPGSYVEPLDFDAESQGTKSYSHPLPGLAAGFRAGNGNGNGRGRVRRDSLDDSD
jgi:hypothetical protein